jgi:hypothetical protein
LGNGRPVNTRVARRTELSSRKVRIVLMSQRISGQDRRTQPGPAGLKSGASGNTNNGNDLILPAASIRRRSFEASGSRGRGRRGASAQRGRRAGDCKPGFPHAAFKRQIDRHRARYETRANLFRANRHQDRRLEGARTGYLDRSSGREIRVLATETLCES